jgi:regulator of protease activity HflC (stomatin/prohibitin superfamily)
MKTESLEKNDSFQYEEIIPKKISGMAVLLGNILLMIGTLIAMILSIVALGTSGSSVFIVILLIVSSLYVSLVGPIIFAGLKVLKPNEALVLTLFGKYYGTLKGEGFFFVNPFVTAVNPTASSDQNQTEKAVVSTKTTSVQTSVVVTNKKISLKAMTLNNEKQKINDALGNPIVIGIVVIWKVVNTAKAVFSVDNFKEYLSIQCDSALRNIVRLYPYDTSDAEGEKSLRGSSHEVALRLKEEIQSKAEIAGIEIIEARITHLSYAPEIAAVMLQRQQASAIIAARQMIVEGAVGMVEMALAKLNENQIVQLDEERKAAMVSNLLVVLCGNKDAQPIINSGTIY